MLMVEPLRSESAPEMVTSWYRYSGMTFHFRILLVSRALIFFLLLFACVFALVECAFPFNSDINSAIKFGNAKIIIKSVTVGISEMAAHI